jgi:hypothetical protein
MASLYEVAWKRVAASASTTHGPGDWVATAIIVVATCLVSLPVGWNTGAAVSSQTASPQHSCAFLKGLCVQRLAWKHACNMACQGCWCTSARLRLSRGLLAACAGFFKWEPIKLQTALLPAVFTIIAPGFTEEVPLHPLHPPAPAACTCFCCSSFCKR